MDSNDYNCYEEHIPIPESLEKSNAVFCKLIETNEMTNSLEALEPYVNKSMYHCGFKAMGLVMIAGATFNKDDIERARKAGEHLTKLTNRYRRTGFLLSLMKLIKTPNYRKYTDLELHAELIHTYSIALNGAIFAISTFNIYGLIKLVYRAQKFVKNFQACRIINRMDIEWESDISQTYFEAGVRLCNGLYHLGICNVPPKLLKIVNFLGYHGTESIGWYQVNKVAFQLDGGFNSQFARGILLAYWLYVEPHGCLGATNLEICLEVLNKEIDRYPKSQVLIGALAKYEQINGRIDKTIEMCNYLLEIIHPYGYKAVHGELIFCYALKCDWDQCIKYAELIRGDSVHSPAIATFAEAVFRYIKSVEDNDPVMKEQATELFLVVPSLRIRHLGKTLTPEKVAVVLSEKYLKNNQFFNLIEVDILYQSNYLSFIKGDAAMLNKFTERIERQFQVFKPDKFDSDYLDNYLTALFFKGIVLKLKGSLIEAKECFKEIILEESRIGMEYSIPPQAMLELGLTELELNNKEGAEECLSKCIDDYKGYVNENFVIIRAYAGLRLLGVSSDKHREEEAKMMQFKTDWLKDLNITQDSYVKLITEEDEIQVL